MLQLHLSRLPETNRPVEHRQTHTIAARQQPRPADRFLVVARPGHAIQHHSGIALKRSCVFAVLIVVNWNAHLAERVERRGEET